MLQGHNSGCADYAASGTARFVNAYITGDRETAERWTAELAAGTLPEPTEDVP